MREGKGRGKSGKGIREGGKDRARGGGGKGDREPVAGLKVVMKWMEGKRLRRSIILYKKGKEKWRGG